MPSELHPFHCAAPCRPAAPPPRRHAAPIYNFRMRVEFCKREHKGRVLAGWDATRGKRTRVPGAVMAAGKSIPHDLAQYVIEASAGYHNGFWDLVVRGATFKSTGRRRTKPGRAVIAAHRDELAGVEKLAGLHKAGWKARRSSPVTDNLDRAMAQWNELEPEQRLVFIWPSPHGAIVPAASVDHLVVAAGGPLTR
jgi:hypothetical protein